MPYRLLLASAFIGPESEQNSSRLQTDCDRDRWQSSPNHRGQSAPHVGFGVKSSRSVIT
jgi:hypothetical protein